MSAPCRMGFKEWSVICAALASGRQSLILRKGGIHEGTDGFRVAHHRFWLFPTQYHQAAQSVTADAEPFIQAAARDLPPPDRIRLELLCEVTDVRQITAPDVFSSLQPFHIWSAATIEQRFLYREPGLFALVVRVYKSVSPIEIADETRFAGCRSWVEFADELPTTGVEPVLGDQAFAERRQAVLAACSSRSA